jgi:hypothetical protein
VEAGPNRSASILFAAAYPLRNPLDFHSLLLPLMEKHRGCVAFNSDAIFYGSIMPTENVNHLFNHLSGPARSRPLSLQEKQGADRPFCAPDENVPPGRWVFPEVSNFGRFGIDRQATGMNRVEHRRGLFHNY